MIPIIKWTLWQRRWSIFWWSAGISAFIILNMVFYPTFKDQAAELQKSFSNIPDTAVQLIGGSTDFFSPIGFLNSQIFFLMLPLLLGVLAIGLGNSLIGREESDMTIETLLARPLSRGRLLGAKALAGESILAAVTLISFIVTALICQAVKLGLPTTDIALATLDCFLLVLTFGAVAFLVSAFGRARSASIGIASLIALGGYIISSLAGTVGWLKGPAKIFPFHYYGPEAVLRHTYNWSNILFFLAVLLVSGLLSWLVFRRRDIA